MAHNRRLSQFANTVGYSGGNIGLGSQSPHAKLEVNGGQNQTANQFTDLVSIAANANNDGIAAEVQLNFGISPSHTAEANRKARIQSVTHGGTVTPLLINPAGGNIGVGVDAPAYLVHIHNSGTGSGDHSYLQFTTGDTGATGSDGLTIGVGANETAYFNYRESNPLVIATSGTERLRITSDGKFGFNTTNPGCQLGGIHAVHDSTQGTPSFTGAEVGIFQRNYNGAQDCAISIVSGNNASSIINFGDKDDVNPGIIEYLNGSNAMRFSTNAGERLRIDSSGRLLVGGTSARTNFNNGTASPQIQIENVANGNKSSIALIHNENALSDSSALHFAKTRGGTVGDDSALNQAGDRLGQIVFSGHDGSEFVQAATIEGLTDATPGNNDMPGRLSFSVTHDGASSVVERMRINRKGFLKMGPRITDSSHGAADLDSVRHEFTSDDNGWTMYVQHTSGAASENEGILIRYRTTSPNGTGNSFIQGQDSNGAKFRFASNGGLYNYQSNDSNLCDEREKKNIVSLDTKWDKVKSWELKKFHYNEDADSDDLRYGVIAQQVEEHCPEVVADWVKQKAESAVLDENENVVTPAVPEITRKGVKEQQMMWMAIKALQEAQTRIETLEAQVAALQGS